MTLLHRSRRFLSASPPALTLLALFAGSGLLGSGPALGSFVRGDANGDLQVDVADPVAILAHLFAGAPVLSCMDAGDSDDSGHVDISDPIRLLDHLFQGGAAPAAPYPLPGEDPTADPLACPGAIDLDEPFPVPPEAGPDIAWASDSAQARVALEEGRPLEVDPATFDALLALEEGQAVSALGPAGTALLAAFFESPLLEGGPTARASDALAPLGPEGCFVVPPQLIDAGSYDFIPAGSFVRGDLDGDGQPAEADAGLLASCLSGSGPCPEACWDAADADDDGEITPADVERIRQAAAGELPLPVPGPEGPSGDPTPDRLPGCSEPGRATTAGLTLLVNPPRICGAGPHLVTLAIRDRDGNEAAARAVVTLCHAGEGNCPDEPLPLAPPGGPGGGLGGPVACRWVTSRDLIPEEADSDLRQRVFGGDGALLETRRGAPLATGGAMDIVRSDLGPGQNHAIFGTRIGASCRTPPTEVSVVRSGRTVVRVNLLCLGPGGVPVSCSSEAEVEGMYQAKVEVGVSAGPACGTRPNRVEALAEDEGQLQASGEVVFQKGAAVHRANEVSVSPSISMEVGGPGVAANPRVRFGNSVNSQHGDGGADDLVDAFGSTKTGLPLTVDLQGKGRVVINAFHRTRARAKARMLVGGFWLVAKTSCPVPAPLYLAEISGEDGHTGVAVELAESFRRSRLGN